MSKAAATNANKTNRHPEHTKSRTETLEKYKNQLGSSIGVVPYYGSVGNTVTVPPRPLIHFRYVLRFCLLLSSYL